MDSYLFRRNILAQLEASFPASLPLKIINMGMSISGFENCDSVEKHLAYLEQKNFIEVIPSAICPAFKRYKITAHGIDFLNGGDF